jgi:hypothetical protein
VNKTRGVNSAVEKSYDPRTPASGVAGLSAGVIVRKDSEGYAITVFVDDPEVWRQLVNVATDNPQGGVGDIDLWFNVGENLIIYFSPSESLLKVWEEEMEKVVL